MASNAAWDFVDVRPVLAHLRPSLNVLGWRTELKPVIAAEAQMSDTHQARINLICSGCRMATLRVLGRNALSKR